MCANMCKYVQIYVRFSCFHAKPLHKLTCTAFRHFYANAVWHVYAKLEVIIWQTCTAVWHKHANMPNQIHTALLAQFAFFSRMGGSNQKL